jgi:hypothetical protein
MEKLNAFHGPETYETYCTGGWFGKRTGIDGSEKFRPHRNSNPGPFNRKRVVMPTTISWPTLVRKSVKKLLVS